jgi:radical SAM protein with 4Fe4S-binding SPASM domain
LRAAGKAVSLRATLTRDGLDALRALVDEALDMGITQLQVEPSSLVGRGANLNDGPPEPSAFADAFLDAFPYALAAGVQLSTAAWSHTRVGDGRYCSAIQGGRALTPDGFLSACTEVGDGHDPQDPFIVGRQLADGAWDIWPARERLLQGRIGYRLPECRHCFMVDTCAGGCASRARAQSGHLMARDLGHCLMSRRINARLIADLADGRLLPDLGWQPMAAELSASASALPGCSGRLVALVPPFARSVWNADPLRRPAFAIPRDAPCFFHLAPGD